MVQNNVLLDLKNKRFSTLHDQTKNNETYDTKLRKPKLECKKARVKLRNVKSKEEELTG